MIRIIQTTIVAICLLGFGVAHAQTGSCASGGSGTTVGATEDCPKGCIKISAPAPGQPNCLPAETAFPQWVSTVYNLSITLAIILATIMIIYGGYKYMTSSGNPDAIAEAKDIITGAIVGLVLLILAALLLRTISPSIVGFS